MTTTQSMVTPRMVLDAIKAAGGRVSNGFPYDMFPGQARWVEGAVNKLVNLDLLDRVRVDGGFGLVAK